MKTPAEVLRKLVNEAFFYCSYHTDNVHRRNRNAEKVGQLVTRSSPEDRELLKQLTPADISSDFSPLAFMKAKPGSAHYERGLREVEARRKHEQAQIGKLK
jgi:hypothetical protein